MYVLIEATLLTPGLPAHQGFSKQLRAMKILIYLKIRMWKMAEMNWFHPYARFLLVMYVYFILFCTKPEIILKYVETSPSYQQEA
jgi:hypothetical protein